jgi:hypothetical protein
VHVLAEASEAPATEGGASWFLDAFRPTLIQALANMTLVLRNVAVRCNARGVAASAACSLVRAASVADAGAASRPVSVLLPVCLIMQVLHMPVVIGIHAFKCRGNRHQHG